MAGRGGQLTVAMAAGYLLGRRHRLRWVLALGTAAAAGRLAGGGGGPLRGGAGALRAVPEVARLADAGGPLLRAGRAAAKAAVGGRVEALTGRLQDAAESLREPVPRTGGQRRRGYRPDVTPRRSGDGDEPDDGYDEPDDEYDEPDANDDEDRDEPDDSLDEDRDDEDDDDSDGGDGGGGPDEDAFEDVDTGRAARPKAGRGRTGTGRPPVRRGGR